MKCRLCLSNALIEVSASIKRDPELKCKKIKIISMFE